SEQNSCNLLSSRGTEHEPGVLTQDASLFSSSMRFTNVTLFSGVTVIDTLLPVVEDTGKLDKRSIANRAEASIMVESELSSLE
ncbi:hypothetical protein A2U01_0019291, partial [Trifolium medium]|nr:hypothetical protein [Trifolium medium]